MLVLGKMVISRTTTSRRTLVVLPDGWKLIVTYMLLHARGRHDISTLAAALS